MVFRFRHLGGIHVAVLMAYGERAMDIVLSPRDETPMFGGLESEDIFSDDLELKLYPSRVEVGEFALENVRPESLRSSCRGDEQRNWLAIKRDVCNYGKKVSFGYDRKRA